MMNTEKHTTEIRRVTFVGLGMNLALSAVKGAAGVLASSQALVADAVHSLSDCVTDIAVLVGANYWSAPADEHHPYGHARIQTLISFFIGLALAAAAVSIGWHAVTTIAGEKAHIPGWAAFWAAILSILVKEALYRVTARIAKRVRSSALMANAWHHRSDAMSSIPVAVAVMLGQWSDAFVFADKVAAVLVCTMLLKAAWSISWPCLQELMESSASQEVCAALTESAYQVDGVREIHKLRTRRIGNGLLVDLHVLVDPQMSVRDGHEIAKEVRAVLLQADMDVVDTLVHLEPFDEQTRQLDPHGC
ncbi:cation diffusion facilitator family transporter [Verrucomicrobiota bacterium]